MPKWKFWDKAEDASNSPSPVSAEPSLRFNLKPRTDLPGINQTLDPGTSDKLRRLRQRRDSALFELEQAESANLADNEWQQRIALLQEAAAAVELERERVLAETLPPGVALAQEPLVNLVVSVEEPPSVSFGIADEVFRYQEELDWAERGFQLVRGELELVSGDVTRLIPDGAAPEESARLVDHLSASLFTFASDMRDRALAGEELSLGVALADLARPDLEFGGWLDWRGNSAVRANRDQRLHELATEAERLEAERAQELEQEAIWADRVSVARRRLANVDAEIAAVEV